MKEKPILFTQENILKILDGTKTQTRRPCKNVPEYAYDIEFYDYGEGFWKCGIVSNGRAADWPEPVKLRYDIGDLLYVREAWQTVPCEESDGYAYVYRASQNGRDWEENTDNWKWNSPLFMPKEAARIWLQVEDRWIERVQDITDIDALAEGCCAGWCDYPKTDSTARDLFGIIWNSIYHEKHKPEFMWENNPWVEVYKFRRVDK